MKKSFLVASVAIASIVSVSIAQTSKSTSNDTVVKSLNNIQDTVPKKDTTTPKKDSSSVKF